ncbi:MULTISPECIES: ParB/RepB/Spo0J family partition protein [unclassified Salipiger]|uniref:ParB/RepB/Spo0J family partition protein n=1 Tax=unclassified Salipiger TaxID=2640570 RepID=UPI00080AB093|nr:MULTISPECIES: ParB/RepB/Spo0J family partition protein [unclassified Salipiger]ANT60254.1 chromosome partitioning protein ParB [Salipiger sp. CCB-MM3]NDV98195.1 ParB/RepB/Spo0J family partition protein [Salipiger sp. PrR002]NDW54907.1 ParB/RepB/Spo0J family partition protein [Salipiger sp. PrR004]
MAEKREMRRGLGRGLSALMSDVDVRPAEAEADTTPRTPDRMIPIEKLFPNKDQPRRTFTPDQLNELAESIRVKGIIQPIIVRPRPGSEGEFEIVAGERRWRAAQMAQLHEVPALVREFDDIEVLEVAIIENIQRADLNSIEEAAGYKQLMNRFGHTQEKIAEALGKSRSHIANLLRLLNLPESVQTMVVEGQLTAGHARTLVTAENPEEVAKEIVRRKLSVRQAEQLAKPQPQKEQSPSRTSLAGSEKDADTRALEGDLSAAVGMKVAIQNQPGQENGKLTISYRTFEELDKLCAILSAAR